MTARSHTRINRKPVPRRGIRQPPGIVGLRTEFRQRSTTLADVHAAENPDEEETQ